MLADEIKNYDIGQMEELAQRLRERLVTVVRENGGHLASNLGVGGGARAPPPGLGGDSRG